VVPYHIAGMAGVITTQYGVSLLKANKDDKVYSSGVTVTVRNIT